MIIITGVSHLPNGICMAARDQVTLAVQTACHVSAFDSSTKILFLFHIRRCFTSASCRFRRWIIASTRKINISDRISGSGQCRSRDRYTNAVLILILDTL